jgi:hypothetical protein
MCISSVSEGVEFMISESLNKEDELTIDRALELIKEGLAVTEDVITRIEGEDGRVIESSVIENEEYTKGIGTVFRGVAILQEIINLRDDK